MVFANSNLSVLHNHSGVIRTKMSLNVRFSESFEDVKTDDGKWIDGYADMSSS